jgi:hypothetical protein
VNAEAVWLVPPEKPGCLICHEDHEITPETHPEVWENAERDPS